MIGVIPNPDQRHAVEEFFQLFKTPWEFYREGRSYSVVLTTGDTIPSVNANLVLVYGSELKSCDRRANLAPRILERDVVLACLHGKIPLYGEALVFQPGHHRVICATAASDIAGLELQASAPKLLRIGYDLFQEIEFLLTVGQPAEHADMPTLELHIALLRELILGAGIPLIEIAPTPAGYEFSACLTHDIDFVGIRRHRFDHTMWGFLYRSTAGAVRDFLKRKLSLTGLARRWKAAASLPLVYLGWLEDFWNPFDWYLKIEKNLSPTYFLIPFKRKQGEKVTASHPERRATAYDITDIPDWTAKLLAEGCEIGVHGIDAWHSIDKGREELAQVSRVTKSSQMGIRMHWLLHDENTYRTLEDAGYDYDTTAGYNDATGYRCGTSQVFRPLSAQRLLELPMHIQDGALFFHNRLDLSEEEAWSRCQALTANARTHGGVLTLLWHDRSPGPERFWGDFYARLVADLKSRRVWFASASQIVSWFRKRREVGFERVETTNGATRIKLRGNGHSINPPLRVRVHVPQAGETSIAECDWDGRAEIEPYFEKSANESTKSQVAAGQETRCDALSGALSSFIALATAAALLVLGRLSLLLS